MAEAAAVQKMRDELPEEERKGNLGKMLRYILNICQAGWSFREALTNAGAVCTLCEQTKAIETMLEKLTEDGKRAILQALEFQKQNATEAMLEHYWNYLGCSLTDLCEGVAQDKLTDHEKTKKLILRSIKDFQKKEFNKLITNMAYGSAFVAVVHCVKIYKAWKKLSNASNLIQGNPDKVKTINSELQRMEQMVTELLDLCERDPNDRRISLKMGRINTHYNSTLTKISALRIKIDGQIQRVDLVADYALIDGAVNLATAGTLGLQLWHTWQHLTSFTKTLGVLCVGVFAGLAAANAKTYFVSQKPLQALRKDLKEAVRLQNQLHDLFEQAEQAFNEIAENC